MAPRGFFILFPLVCSIMSAFAMPMDGRDLQDVLSDERFETVHGRILAVNMATLGKRRLQHNARKESSFENIEKLNDGQHLDLYQGDIQLDEDLEEYLHMPNRSRTKRNAVREKKLVWNSRFIPYTIPPAMAHIKTNFMKAIAEYHKYTCLRFIPYRPGFHKHYITFDRKLGCSSRVGMRHTGGRQVISLGDGCNNVPTIMHEVMHAVGFFHEQARSDRDRYVRINWENILKGFKDQFDKYSWITLDHLRTNYDYKSIMHYDRMSFTKNGRPTIVAIGNENMELNNFKFSATDIIEINTLYNCKAKRYGWSRWSDFTPCDDKCYKSRQRFCYNPGKKTYCGGNTNAYGIEHDKRKCTKRECDERFAIHGHWSRWSDWTKCSATCDNGIRRRIRRCDNPKPGKNGRPCAGDAQERGVCTTRRCHLGYDDTDFEGPYRPLGMWQNKHGSQIQWRRHTSFTKTMETGPFTDHTTGKGYYLYMESSAPAQRNYKAILTSPLLTTKQGGQCLKFAYSMYGRTTGSLEIKLRTPSGSHLRLFYKSGDQGNFWHTSSVSLEYRTIPSFRLEIIATVGKRGYSDIAIDDVYLDDGSCSCQDKYVKCREWSKQGDCQKNKKWMADHCKRSCKICKDKIVTTPNTICNDKNEVQCPLWEAQGQCSINKDWMHKNCRKSCKLCKATNCKDENEVQCPLWEAQGDCNKNKDWMHKNCPKSCKICIGPSPQGPCADKKSRCKEWARNRECTKTPLYMKVYCKKSCGWCR